MSTGAVVATVNTALRTGSRVVINHTKNTVKDLSNTAKLKAKLLRSSGHARTFTGTFKHTGQQTSNKVHRTYGGKKPENTHLQTKHSHHYEHRRYSLITFPTFQPQIKDNLGTDIVVPLKQTKAKPKKQQPVPVEQSPAMIRLLSEPVRQPVITMLEQTSNSVQVTLSTESPSQRVQQATPKETVQDFGQLSSVLDILEKNPGALADSREVAQLVAQLSKELNIPNPMAPQRRATISFGSATVALPSIFPMGTTTAFPSSSSPFGRVHARHLHSIAFTDSGVGGLFFLYDALQKLLPVLLDAAKQYKLEDRPVEFVHLGDTANAPYGGKTREQIAELTIGLIRASNQVSDAIVVACNTASSTRPMIWDSPAVRSIVSEKPVLTLIEDSAQALYEASTKQIVTGSDGEKTLYIGFLGTPALVDSGRYQDTLRAIHKKAIEDGQIPVGTKLEIVAYGPKEWVANIEAGKTDILNLKVAEDMAVLKGKAGAEHIKIWGSYCTHFPYVTEGILKVLDPDKSKGIAMLSQGAIFAEKLATIFRAELAQDFEHRETVLTTEQAEKFLANYFQIRSLISGQNQDAVQFAASQFNPELALKTIFGGQYPTPPVSQ